MRRVFARLLLWVVVAASTLLLRPADLVAQDASEENVDGWGEIESDHFSMLFPLRREAFARHALVYAEHAYGVISKKLDVELDSPISIRIVDRVDEVLPLSESAGSNSFVLSTWPPQGLLDGPYRGDWLERAVYHHVAYTLIHNTRAQLSPFLSSLLSPLTRNNRYVPSWYVHGLSSWLETPEAPGRVIFDSVPHALLRSDALDDEIPRLGSIMSGRRSWLAERASGIYGVAFLTGLAHAHGEDVFARWNHENAQMLVPFTSDLTTKRIFGKTWEDLYEDWQAGMAQEVAQSDPNGKEDFVGKLLTEPWKHEHPQAVPGRNAVSYVHEDGVSPRRIVMLDLDSGETDTIVECRGQCEHHWSVDGQTVFFTDMIHENRHRIETLYYRRLSDILSRRIDMPGHVRSFAVGPDAVYAVIMDGDAPKIYRTSLVPGAKTELVYSGNLYELIEDIVWIGENTLVGIVSDADSRQYDVFSFRDIGEKLEPRRLTDNTTTEMYPFAMQGEAGFVVEDGGTYSVMAIDPASGRLRVIHAQRDGIFQPTQATDGTLFYTRIIAKGMAIASLLPAQLHPSEDSPRMYHDIAPPISTIYAAEAEAVQKLESTPYNVGTAFIPRSVMPVAGYSAATGFYEGIDVSNDDVLKHHSYTLHYAYFNRRNTHEFSLEYRWSQYQWWIETTGGARQDTYTYDSGERMQYFPSQTFWAKLQTGTEWHFPDIDIGFKVQYLLEFNQALKSKEYDEVIEELNAFLAELMGPDADIPQVSFDDIYARPSRTSAIIADLSLRHTHKAYRTIPGETGYSFEMEFRFEAPFLFADYYSFIDRFALTMSWSMPWLETHVFLLHLKYGFSYSENESRLAYDLHSSAGFDFSFNDSEPLMHGYRAGNSMGNNMLYAHVEYSYPIAELEAGLSYIPFGLNRIGAEVYSEFAHIWFENTLDSFQFNIPSVSLGAEVHFDGTLAYTHDFRLSLGYAYGFMEGGDHSYYFKVDIAP